MNAHNYTFIEKYSHPWYISVLSALTLILAFYSTITLIWIEIPFHRELEKQITHAEQHLINKDFETAFEIYKKILIQFPNYRYVQLKMTKTCFLLASSSDRYMYELGLIYAEELQNLKKDELKTLKSALSEEFKDDFKSKLQRVVL